jgi:hypothetical protein
VNALGTDASNNTYWYFYGVRLYVEDPMPRPIKQLKKSLKSNKRSKRTSVVKPEPIPTVDCNAVAGDDASVTRATSAINAIAENSNGTSGIDVANRVESDVIETSNGEPLESMPDVVKTQEPVKAKIDAWCQVVVCLHKHICVRAGLSSVHADEYATMACGVHNSRRLDSVERTIERVYQ